MQDALLSLGLLLVVAKLAEGLATRLRQSALGAYVLTGIVLGPVLGVVDVEAETDLTIFFSVGIIFLFFLTGIDEIDISGFVETLRGRFFLAAAVALIVPLGASLAVAHYVLEISWASSIAVAGVISLSSLGVVVKVLGDLDHLKEPLGLEIFTTVMIVELVGLLIVGFTLEEVENPGDFKVWKVAALLGQITGFALVAWVLASRLFPPMLVRLRRLLGVPQLSFGLVIGGLFLLVVGAEEIGLHGALGALLLGTALSSMPHRLRWEVLPGVRSMAQGLFIPLFFASAGLHLDTSFTTLSALTIASLVTVAVVRKFAGAALGALIARLDVPLAVASGLMAKGGVEVALLLVMLDAGAISQELFSLLTIIMLGFIFLVPVIIGLAVGRARVGEEPHAPHDVVPSFARYTLEDVNVVDIMDEGRPLPRSSLSVQDFAEHWLTPDQHHYVVAGEDGKLAGILSLHRLHGVSRDRWETTSIRGLLSQPLSPRVTRGAHRRHHGAHGRSRHDSHSHSRPGDGASPGRADQWRRVLPHRAPPEPHARRPNQRTNGASHIKPPELLDGFFERSAAAR